MRIEFCMLAVDMSIATPVQMMAMWIGTLLVLSICIGSILAWLKWLSGNRPKNVATKPMATVGLVDVIATAVFLLTSAAVTMVIWQLAVKPLLGDTLSQLQAPTELQAPADLQAPAAEPPAPTVAPPTSVALTADRFLFSGFVYTAELICVLLATVFICTRTNCAIRQLGWRTDRWQADLLAGFQVYLMVTPVILILNTFLSQWTGVPYVHPIHEMIKTHPWLLMVAFWLVSVVAPVFEEFAFRTVLIGWFESIHIGKNKLAAIAFGEPATELATVTFTVPASEPSIAPASESSHEPAIDEPACLPNLVQYSPPWWPAILSGIIFGLAHFSYGVSWVNLSLLGIVLGRLYQVRQSLIPVIVVHCLFNSTSIVFLGIQMLLPDAAVQPNTVQ